MRLRRKPKSPALTPEQLDTATRDARNSVPEMPSRHIPTEWWVVPTPEEVS